MVDFIKKFGLIIALCFFCSDVFAAPPVYGPLQAQNNLSDVDSVSTSLANIGGAPLASPTFTGTVTIPSGSVLNTPAAINLTNATNVPYSSLPALSSNQLLGSLTATTPSGQSVPSCSASNDALLWTSGVGFSCNSSVNAATLGGATFASPGSIGSSTPSTGAFTNLSSSGTVSGTGFSTYLASPPSIGTTTPGAGKFTTLQATSTITPSTTSGIVGTTSADNANAGSVGEYISSSVADNTVNLSTGTQTNITSITLTAGDWQCNGNIVWVAAATTVPNGLFASISTTSATLATPPGGGAYAGINTTFGTNTLNAMATGSVRENVNTSTTLYLVSLANFTTSTMTAGGFLGCRRVR